MTLYHDMTVCDHWPKLCSTRHSENITVKVADMTAETDHAVATVSEVNYKISKAIFEYSGNDVDMSSCKTT